jgi:hypothetical protein
MPSVTKQEFDLRLLELKFLKAKLEINRDLASAASAHFASAFNNFIKNNLSKEDRKVFEDITKKGMIDNSKKRAEEVQKEEIKEIQPPSSTVRKIFRNIAKEIHPDKLVEMTDNERKEKEELFKVAQEAADKKNLSDLYEISEKLKVELPPPDDSQIEILNEEIETLKKELKGMKSTASWEWYNADDKVKEILMVRYIQFIYETCK